MEQRTLKISRFVKYFEFARNEERNLPICANRREFRLFLDLDEIKKEISLARLTFSRTNVSTKFVQRAIV